VLAEIGSHLTGKTPFVTIDGLRMSRYRMFFSSAKAERELGYRARPYEAAIREAIAWFREAGYLQ
jgi:dihydroflavonol-4-reductase